MGPGKRGHGGVVLGYPTSTSLLRLTGCQRTLGFWGIIIDLKMNEGDVYLANCAITHTILQDKIYFLDLTLTNFNVSTISSTTNLIESFG